MPILLDRAHWLDWLKEASVTNESTDDTRDDKGTPAIQIDDDWKAEAQADKAKLAEQEQAAGDASDGSAGKGKGANALPPADFKGLVGVLASQAVMGLGAMPDPQGRGVMIDLDGAKFAIDLLAVIEEKTVGNLTEEEAKELSGVVVELRARFVQVTQLLADQMQSGGPSAGNATPPSSTSASGGASKIIMPD